MKILEFVNVVLEVYNPLVNFLFGVFFGIGLFCFVDQFIEDFYEHSENG